MEFRNHPERRLCHLLSAPFIYIMIIPLLILDIFLWIYHNICFRLYNIPLVCRAQYIKIDRHKLSKLNLLEKLNCAYCGYANGLLNYAVKVAAETEKYWCSIKHERTKNFIEPSHHKDFINYEELR